MASFAENGPDVLMSRADSYVRYAFAAQQEFFELGMNLLTRQLDTGRRIVGARDFGEAFAACSDLVRASAEDLSSTATRLFDRASDAGHTVVEDTAQSVRQVAAAATEAVQKVDEVVEKSEQVVRATVRRSRKRAQAASAAMQDAARTTQADKSDADQTATAPTNPEPEE